MRFQEFVLVVAGVVCIFVFFWTLSAMCSQPTIAHAANWLSALAFALLGPIWSLQITNSVTSTRMVLGFFTIIIGFLAALVAPPFQLACH
jgi:hypothetical protein